MTTYVILLRGINVGGHRALAMADLRALCEGLGHTQVNTYIQSGNVVLRSEQSAATVSRGLEQAIAAQHELEVGVVVRTRAQFDAVVRAVPYDLTVIDPRTVYVTFLTRRPAAALTRDLVIPGCGGDDFRVIGAEVYLHCPGGYGQTVLTNALWERRLSSPATSRGWRTVLKLADMAASV